MLEPAYTDGWNASKAARYLLANPKFVEWRVTDELDAEWIDSEGRSFHMMDDIEARWLAVWKFVADRQRVTREELLAEFPTSDP